MFEVAFDLYHLSYCWATLATQVPRMAWPEERWLQSEWSARVLVARESQMLHSLLKSIIGFIDKDAGIAEVSSGLNHSLEDVLKSYSCCGPL